MRSNDWSHLTGDQWLVMALVILASCALVILLQRLGKPRANKWADWRVRK